MGLVPRFFMILDCAFESFPRLSALVSLVPKRYIFTILYIYGYLWFTDRLVVGVLPFVAL